MPLVWCFIIALFYTHVLVVVHDLSFYVCINCHEICIGLLVVHMFDEWRYVV